MMRQAPCQPSWPIWIGLRKMPRRSGPQGDARGAGGFSSRTTICRIGFVMVPYRSLPLRHCSGDLRSITPLSQERAYQQPPASKNPRLLWRRLRSDETELKPFLCFDETTFRLSA